ncbi:MAG: type II secretion system F family protein [Anaerolineales bacterium]
MPFHGFGVLGYGLVLIAAWLGRRSLYAFVPAHLTVLIGISGGFLLFMLALPVIEIARRHELRQSWRRRLEKREGLPRPPSWTRSLLKITQPVNRFLTPFFGRGLGLMLLGLWKDAGFGSQPFSLILSIGSVIGGGGLIGYLFTRRVLLSGFAGFLLLIGLIVLTYTRARMQRRQFQDQFPGVLDRLADSLQAGFSLPQAISFVIPNLPPPSSTEMELISNQIQMGFTADQALRDLYQRRTNEDVRLLVEGLTLQRQVGGNMAAMMRDMAEVVRKRVELENEVRTMTAQGRLSAVVIALLVPVSLGLLSMFPGYVDVLFKTTIGNLILIAAGILESIGAVIVARLIRIEV